MSYYGSLEYWNERYLQKNDEYEWYTSYSILKDHICKYINKEDTILNIGCGNSNLSEDLYRDGYYNITSCDYSSVVINKMKEMCIDKSGLKWDVMDVHNMTYADGSFDAVIDKATLDAIICGDEAVCNPDKVVSEIYRVLKNNGVYICITYGIPEARMDYFQSPEQKWKITHISLRCTSHSLSSIAKQTPPGQTQHTVEYCHHMYICRKSE